MRRTLAGAAVVGMVLALSHTAQAAPIDGSFSFVGTEDVRLGADFIDWGRFDDIFGPPDGGIRFLTGDGTFAGLDGTLGTILDLNIATAPVETPLNVANFITSAAHPEWEFTLNRLFQGAGTVGCVGVTAVGATCTPFLGSPFSIKNEAGGGSSITLAVRGTVMDNVGPASIFNGLFTTQFINLNASQLVALVQSQGYAQSSYSAQFAANANAIPEPASMLLLGAGLACAGFFRRRKK